MGLGTSPVAPPGLGAGLAFPSACPQDLGCSDKASWAALVHPGRDSGWSYPSSKVSPGSRAAQNHRLAGSGGKELTQIGTNRLVFVSSPKYLHCLLMNTNPCKA